MSRRPFRAPIRPAPPAPPPGYYVLWRLHPHRPWEYGSWRRDFDAAMIEEQRFEKVAAGRAALVCGDSGDLYPETQIVAAAALPTAERERYERATNLGVDAPHDTG